MAKPYQTKVFLWDRGAITGSDRPLWEHTKTLGASYLTATTLRELENLAQEVPANRGGGTSIEALADNFVRFYQSSGWRLTDAEEGHPQFRILEGNGRKALENLAHVRTAWGLCRQYPQSLVVLVSADATLVRKLNDLELENLRAATAISLRAWQGNRHAPPAIARALGLTPSAPKARPRTSFRLPVRLLLGLLAIGGGMVFWYTQPHLSQPIWRNLQRILPRNR